MSTLPIKKEMASREEREESIEKIREEMCENYCKYALGIFEIQQEQLEEICEKCPLNELDMEDCYGEKKNY